MATGNTLFASTGPQTWRGLYKAALLETDRETLPSRIDQAERALILKARELSAMSGESDEEAQAIDDALYALQALRNCLKLKTSEPEAA